MKRINKHITVFTAFVIILSVIAPVEVVAANVSGRAITSQGACVIDFETGIMLYGHREDLHRVPASMVKLAAVYVVYDTIKAGDAGLRTQTVISKRTSDFSYNLEYSNVPLPLGLTVSIGTLLDLVIITSACAATSAIGEALYGSEKAFVAKMNEKMISLNIDAVFFDSYGVSADNSITPKGMADLTRYLISDHPEVLVTASKSSVYFGGLVYKNTNQLLGEYSGIDGLKTGYTDAAGYCFVGTAVRNSRRIIAVTMGSDQNARFADTRILLDHGFAVAQSVIAEYRRTKNAIPSGANLILNGSEMPLNAYLIGSSHYFRLRDIALLLSGTGNQFDINWNHEEKTVSITTGLMYSEEGSDLSEAALEAKHGIPTPSRIIIDDIEYALDVYLIDGSNYFRLRDLGNLIGFRVDWIQDTRTVIIDTDPAETTDDDADEEEESELPEDTEVLDDTDEDSELISDEL